MRSARRDAFLFHMVRAADSIERGDLQSARAELDGVPELEPSDPSQRSSLALLHYRLGNFARALAMHEALATDLPDDATLALNAAKVAARLGKWDRARAHLERAHAIRPSDRRIAGWLERARAKERPPNVPEGPEPEVTRYPDGLVSIDFGRKVEMLVRPGRLHAVHGSFEVLPDRMACGSSALRVRGEGAILFRAGRTLTPMWLWDQEAVLRADAIAAYEVRLLHILMGNGALGAIREFCGRGLVLLESEQPVASVEVSKERPASLRVDTVLGWSGKLEIDAASEWARLTGRATLFFSTRGAMNDELPGYEILRRLGDSRRVFLGRRKGSIQREVVMKRREGDGVVERANRYARIQHPALPLLLDLVRVEGGFLVVEERCEGIPLAVTMREERLVDGAALHIAHAIFGALAAAHEAPEPLCHGNVRAEKVIVSPAGEVKLLDLGGEGTPEDDVYDATLLLFEMLTGRPRLPSVRMIPLEALRPDMNPLLCDAVMAGVAKRIRASEMVSILEAVSNLARGRGSLRARMASSLPPPPAEVEEIPSLSPPPRFNSIPQTTYTIPPAAPRSRVVPVLSVAASLAAAAAVTLAVLPRKQVPLSRLAVTARAPHVVKKEKEKAEPPPALEAAAPAPDTGIIRTPPSASQNRVWIDGRLMGHGGVEVRVRCGRHEIRVGSAGSLQEVNVPCGGAIDVAKR